MNKKVLTLSLVAVAAIATSVATALAFKGPALFNADGYTGSKTVTFTANSIKNKKTEGGNEYFDLEAPCAFDNTFTLAIKGVNLYGDTQNVGGDHIFEVADGDYWSFQIPSLKIKDTHGGLQSINLLKQTGEDQFEVVANYDTSYVIDYYDIDKDEYDITIYEHTYTLGGTSCVVDRITVTYSCNG